MCYNKADVKALVDSGATNNFINPRFAKRMGIGMTPLPTPQKIWNIDNTENVAGKITHSSFLNVTTHGQTCGMTFLVTDIGNEDILLGYPWLAKYKPNFSWRHATIDEKALPVIIQTIHPKRHVTNVPRKGWQTAVWRKHSPTHVEAHDEPSLAQQTITDMYEESCD